MPRKKANRIIPSAPVGRIIQNAGAKRVSAEGVEALADVLEERAAAIGKKAVDIAKHTGRKTVHAGDVKLAASK